MQLANKCTCSTKSNMCMYPTMPSTIFVPCFFATYLWKEKQKNVIFPLKSDGEMVATNQDR